MDLLEAYKTIYEIREKIEELTEEERKKAIDKLSDKEQKAFKEVIRAQIKMNYVFRGYDDQDYTDDIKELKARCEDIKEAINSLRDTDLYYTKESLTENNYILCILAHYIKDASQELDADMVNDLINRYNKINDFIYDNYDNELYEQILDFYDAIVDKDENGFYKVNDAIANKLLSDSNLIVTDENVLKDIKDAINLTWENKKEILDPSKIDEITEGQNGISFKQFIFCEEYLKRGKIKPTCEHLGISRNTAYLWLENAKVKEYLSKRQSEIKQETDEMFSQTYRASFNQLNELINGQYIETGDRIKAIDVFLKHYENIERLKQPSTTYED